MDEQVIIKSGNLTATINYVGAELVSLKKDGQEKIWQGDERYWTSHAPILFPICGGLKDDIYYLDGKKYEQKKHGYVRKVPFALVEKKDNEATFVLSETPESLQGFPFKFNLYIRYELTDVLKIDYKVVNTDNKDMYFTIGAHEGYAIGGKFEDYSIVFEQKEDLNSYILDGNLLSYDYICLGKNSNELALDYKYFEVDALVFKGIKSRKVWLKHKTKGNILSVEFSDFNHLLLWTKPNAPYICIEPWIATPDMTDSCQDITKKPDVVKIESAGQKTFSHVVEFF